MSERGEEELASLLAKVSLRSTVTSSWLVKQITEASGVIEQDKLQSIFPSFLASSRAEMVVGLLRNSVELR